MAEQPDFSMANSNDTSESTTIDVMDRHEASESGVMTQMEESRIVDVAALATQASDDSATHKKGKSRRLTKRVAHTIKKQWKSSDKEKDKNKARSLSPPHSGQESYSDSEEAELVTATTADSSDRDTKKKHKSKFKPVARAAAKAAKKIAGKKSSSSSKKHAEASHEQQLHNAVSGSDNSPRTTTPTELLNHSAGAGGVIGKTPVNTPVTTTNLMDKVIPEHLMQELPSTLTETVDDEEEEREGRDGGYATLKPSTSSDSLAGLAMETTATAQTQPSEDDMVRMAEAMAIAHQNNPTKSPQAIRRMVLNQPEFQHLAQPDIGTMGSGSSGSSKKGFKKTFIGFQSKLTSGAGTAQKKLMEYASGGLESTMGGSVTSFGFMGNSGTNGSVGDSATSKGAAPTATAAAAVVGNVVDVASTLATTATGAVNDAVNDAVTVANGLLPPTIPEDSAAHLEASSDGISLHGSTASFTPGVHSQQAGIEKATSAGSASTQIPAPVGASKVEPPIKLTEIVWKRRSGFGKYLNSSPWERRRFVLQGNSLAYFRAKGELGESTLANPMDDMTERLDDPRGQYDSGGNLEAGGKAGGSSKSGTGTKHRMMDALEQASFTLGLSSVPTTGSEKPVEASSARGAMDLIKENATVCATLGHSGAPSPFCLSIKVNGETKWKLCFATHRSQLMWLAAMTDVCVQASVDSYNVKLLAAADPANQDTVAAAFHSHVYEPPPHSEKSLQSTSSGQSTEGQAVSQQPPDADSLLPQPSLHDSGRRLWMMEPYVIKAQRDVIGSVSVDEAEDDGSLSSVESDDEMPDTAGAPEDEEKHVWSLPENKLKFAAILVNAAILYSRNSTISVQGFWTVVTIANMTLFTFLETGPRPKAQAAAHGRSPWRGRLRKPKRHKGKQGGSERPGGAGDGKNAGGPGGPGGKAKKEKFVPVAGTSASRIENLSDPGTNDKGQPFTRWRPVSGEDLQVRSHGYLTSRVKIPSPGTLYELAQMDIFESPSRFPDMAPRVKLPKLTYQIDPDEQKTWKAPDHFIVSLALPTDPPKLGSTTSDGGGYTVTMYFTMRKTTRDMLKRVTADGYDPKSEERPADIQKYQVNAVRLFEEWCRRAPNDIKFQTRFKMVPLVVNAKEIGLPSWIGKYNGKPLLIKRPGQTGFLLPHPELSCIEFDISLHVFPYLAKQGICYLKDTMFKKLLASVGFVIEGRDDDELPEVVIGLGQVCYPDPAVGMPANEYFAGTAPRSFEPEEVKPAAGPVPVPANPPPQAVP